MLDKVDTGGIIAVKNFPVFPSDDVESLLLRTYDFQLSLFYEIVGKILIGETLPVSSKKWEREPFSRKEFDKLFEITPQMDKNEIETRIRATNYMQFKPVLRIDDFVFEFKGLREDAK